ncbi:hypothetical protein PRUB_a2015 [Pseudoalteromonas rubra]|uniref:Insecticide toxin TcdB middle/N-terminal domain-containing protein n=1 Tax=Pseudoalteromonas rubra TaxID=43658 RepID=A0A8T0CDY4_9GAMM|nr:hypothetical protein PRUB_a2015 [Pseudoalteromonas rubra]
MVEHIAPIIASASVNEDNRQLVLGGAGFSAHAGRLFAQIENTSETHEIILGDITVSASGGVLTAQLTERLFEGYQNKGLLVEYRNQVSCLNNDVNSNYVGKVMCVDSRLTYKVRVDDQSPDTIIDMTENNFTISDSGYVYVGASKTARDSGDAPFYEVGDYSNTVTGLYVYNQNSDDGGWVFSTNDIDDKTDDQVIGKPLVIPSDGIDHVYFGAQNHKVYKFTHNPQNNSGSGFKFIWDQITGGPNTAGLQTDAIGNIYVGSMDQRLYSLLPETGQINWHYSFAPSGGIHALSGVGPDGLAAVTTQDGEMTMIDRTLIDKNAVSWSRLDDYLEMANPGWEPPASYLEANIIGHLLIAVHQRLPSKNEIAALSYAHLNGHSLEEVVNAIINAQVECQQNCADAIALRGSDNLAFTQVLIRRLMDQHISATTTVLGKTAEQWAQMLDTAQLRRAELVLLLQQPTYKNHSDTIQELLNIYFGYCFGSECNYSQDTDNDGIPNLVEIENGTSVNNPIDGLAAPTMTQLTDEPVKEGELLFSLESNDEIDFYIVHYQLDEGGESKDRVDVAIDEDDNPYPNFATRWKKAVRDGTYSFYAKACKTTQVQNQNYNSCSVSGSEVITVEIVHTPSELAPNVVIDNAAMSAQTDTINLSLNAELTPTIGNFRVSEAGSATYSLPIELPQGIAGVTPSVSLMYNSQQGDSSVALGWSLNAGSSISRCRAVLAIDGYSGPVAFDETDKYCLDGQRLIEVDNIDWPISNGVPSATYVLEKDAQLFIERYDTGNSEYFVVYGKDGSKKVFGGESASEVRVGRDDENMATLTWLLVREYDNMQSDSSVVQYDYATLGEGEKVLTTIRYSGYRVEFDYVASKVRSRTYMNHGSLSQSARLSKIWVKTSGSTSIELSSYDIAGNTSQPNGDGPRRLDKLQQCRGTICKKPILFDYNDLPIGHEFKNSRLLFDAKHNGGYNESQLVAFTFLDTQGNGNQELATLERIDGADKEYQLCIWAGQTIDDEQQLGCTNITRSDNDDQVTMLAMDVEGDGSQSLWINNKSDYEEGYLGYYWDKVDFDGARFTFGYPEVKYLTGKYLREIKTADFNGDGYADIAYKKQKDDLNLYIREWDRHAHMFVDEVVISIDTEKEVKATDKGSDWQTVDINFDGLADIIALRCGTDKCADGQPNRLYAYLNNGADAMFTPFTIAATGQYFRQFMLTDINSDGFLDILLQRATNDGDFVWNAYIAKAAVSNEKPSGANYQLVSFDLDGELDTFFSTESAELNKLVSPFVIDSDRNGINELYFKEAGAFNYHWRRFNWNPEAEVIERSSIRIETWGFNAQQGSLVFPADFDNNGTVDLILKSDNDIHAYYEHQQSTQAGLLRTITQGYGSKTQIHYTPMNTEGADAVYSQTMSALSNEMQNIAEDSQAFDEPEHRVQRLFNSLPLVSSVETESAVTGVNDEQILTVNYHYYDAKVQFGGRGMLGFGAITTTTEKDQIEFETTTRYYQAFPFTGMPKATEKRFGAQRISLSVNDYKYLQDKHTKSYQVFVQRSRECSARFDSVDLESRNTASDYFKSGYSCTETVSDEDVWGNVFTNSVKQYDVLPVNVNAFAHHNSSSAKNASTLLTETITSNCYDLACSSSYIDTTDYIKLGRLTEVTVEHVGSDSAPLYKEDKVTKKSAFAYYSSGPEKYLLKEERFNVGAGSDHELVKYYTYDSVGNIVTVTSSTSGEDCASDDALCRVTTNNYDASLHFIDSTSNDYFTPSSVVRRNAFGQPTQIMSVDESLSTVLYDKFGTKIGSHSATGTQRYTYLTTCSASGCAVQQNTLANGVLVEKKYIDINGRVFETHTRGKKDDHWFISKTHFDLHGRAMSQQAPGQEAVTTEYDVFDRVISVQDPNAGTITSHTQVGQTSTVTVSMDDNFSRVGVNEDKGLPGGSAHSQITEKDLLGRNYKVTDNQGNVLTYDYDVLGNNTTVQSSADNKVVLTNKFDAQGRLEYRETLDNGKWVYKYNAFGEVYEQTDARGIKTTTKYDKLGRKVLQTQSGPTDSDVLIESASSWHYSEEKEKDSDSPKITHQLHYATQGQWQQNYYYDEHGRLASTLTDLDGKSCSDKVTFNKTYGDLRYTHSDLKDAVASLCVIQQKFYDAYGRSTYQFDDYRRDNSDGYYAEARGIRKIYNQYGIVVAIQEARDTEKGIRYYDVDTGKVNERGLVTRYNKGLATVTLAYDSQGMVSAIDARYNQTDDETPYLQGDRYRFDSLGNLTYRSTLGLTTAQKFGYDTLNRIKTVNGVEKYQYCNNGNLKLKDGWKLIYGEGEGECDGHRLSERVRETTSGAPVGDFKPFTSGFDVTASSAALALSQKTETYAYDANGNETWMKKDGSTYRTQTYSGRNKVVSITGNGNKEVTFAYDVNNRRYKREDAGQTVYYVGALELTTRQVGNTTERFIRRYIGNEAIQIYYSDSDTKRSRLQWLFTDHQGSVTAVADSNYKLLGRYSYGVFGKRYEHQLSEVDKPAQNSLTLFTTIAPNMRAYTGHEPISLGGDDRVIHMNGRIYDSTTGRFMQADPVVQAPGNLQNYNAYSYVLNNPLSYTDPSGYFFKKLLKGAMKATGTWQLLRAIADNQFMSMFVQIGLALIPGCQSGICHAIYNAATTFAVTGSLNAGLKAGAISYAQSTALQKIGGSQTWGEAGSVQNIAANALVGGVASELQGGKFGHGFLSAGVASAFKPMLNDIGGAQSANSAIKTGNLEMLAKFKMHRIVGAAVIGGTTSVISGGKFANGAISGAFNQAFNGENNIQKMTETVKNKLIYYSSVAEVYGPRVITFAGGVVQVGTGVATCAASGGLACAGGVYLAMHGFNNMWEGWSGTDGLIRQGYRFAGELAGNATYGDFAYGAIDIGMSVYGAAKLVPSVESRKLFRNLNEDMVRSVKETSQGILMFNTTVDINTGVDTYIRMTSQ